MIKHIYSNSDWITVNQNGTAVPYINTSQQMAGMIRMNPSMNRLEVYDGQNWQGISSDAHLDVPESVKMTLRWAKKKMEEEAQLQQLMEKHAGLKDLHEKFELMKTLCYEEEKNE